MSVRDHRTGRVRKAASPRVRGTLRHRDRKEERRNDERSIVDNELDDWASQLDGNSDVWED